ncbi:hypothetical protein WJX82_001357 [Trebouxia sp. C0006]
MGLLLVATGLLALGTAALVGVFYTVPEFEDFRAPFFWGDPEQREFHPIAEGLFKIDLPWHLTPFHEENLDLFLLKSKGGWCLSDAGGYNTWIHKHATTLVEAVKRTIGNDPLTYVLLTHGHIDHVGALSLLLELYPNMKVVIHEAEGPYMEGHKLYFSVEGRSLQLKALHFLEAVPQKQFQMTKDRMILLEGQEGSLKTIGIPEMTWSFTPGHSPGHVVYKHHSGILLGGDFADVLKVDGRHALKVMCPVTCDLDTAKKSICKIAQDLDYSRIQPYHDSWKTGYTKAELLPLANSYAGCAL